MKTLLSPQWKGRAATTSACLLAVFCTSDRLVGQAIPTPRDEEVVILSPFLASGSRDVGYRAGDTTAGAGIAVAIDKLPISITALTSQFIEDAQLMDMDDAINYIGSANIRGAERDQQGFYIVRGFGAPRLRNGMFDYGYTESAFMERAQVVRGPRGALYGQSSPGGMVLLETKRPLFEPAASVRLTTGQYNFHRAVVDVNTPLGSQRDLAVRYIGGFTDNDTIEPDEHQHFINHYAALTWRPASRLTVNLDMEHSERRWAPSQGPAITTLPNGDWVYDYNFAGGREKANWNGPHGHYNNDHSFYAASASYKFNDYLTANVNYQNGKRDRHAHVRVPAWVIAPPARDANGNPIYIMQSRLTIERQRDEQLKASILAEFTAARLKHKGVFAADEYWQSTGVVDRTITNNTLVPNWNPAAPDRNNPDGSIGWPVLPLSFFEADVNNFIWAKGLGYRAYSFNGISQTESENLGILYGIRHDALKQIDTSATTHQLGAIYQVLPSVSLFTSTATSFVDNGVTGGQSIDPTRLLSPENGRGLDIGLKVVSPNKKISGTISYFTLKRSGVKATVAIFDSQNVKIGEDTQASGSESSKGVDFDLVLAPNERWNTFVSGALLDTNVDKNLAAPVEVGQRIRSAPKQQFALFTQYSFRDGTLRGFSIGGGVRHVGRYRNNPGAIGRVRYTDTHTVANVVASYSFKILGHDSSLGLMVDNVTDELYVEREQGYGDPRWIKLNFGVKY